MIDERSVTSRPPNDSCDATAKRASSTTRPADVVTTRNVVSLVHAAPVAPGTIATIGARAGIEETRDGTIGYCSTTDTLRSVWSRTTMLVRSPRTANALNLPLAASSCASLTSPNGAGSVALRGKNANVDSNSNGGVMRSSAGDVALRSYASSLSRSCCTNGSADGARLPSVGDSHRCSPRSPNRISSPLTTLCASTVTCSSGSRSSTNDSCGTSRCMRIRYDAEPTRSVSKNSWRASSTADTSTGPRTKIGSTATTEPNSACRRSVSAGFDGTSASQLRARDTSRPTVNTSARDAFASLTHVMAMWLSIMGACLPNGVIFATLRTDGTRNMLPTYALSSAPCVQSTPVVCSVALERNQCPIMPRWRGRVAFGVSALLSLPASTSISRPTTSSSAPFASSSFAIASTLKTWSPVPAGRRENVPFSSAYACNAPPASVASTPGTP
jgi:hypothetical protein